MGCRHLKCQEYLRIGNSTRDLCVCYWKVTEEDIRLSTLLGTPSLYQQFIFHIF